MSAPGGRDRPGPVTKIGCRMRNKALGQELDERRKQLQKALVEFEKAGERGAAQVAQLRFEIEFCDRYLPKGLDETALRALVRQRLGALGITDAKQVGRLVGDIMKTP